MTIGRYRWFICGLIFAATVINYIDRPSDVFPREAVGSVVGIGGAVGAVGGMVMAKYAGWVLDRIGTYTPIFIVAGSAYLIALLVVHVLSPRLAPVEMT